MLQASSGVCPEASVEKDTLVSRKLMIQTLQEASGHSYNAAVDLKDAPKSRMLMSSYVAGGSWS